MAKLRKAVGSRECPCCGEKVAVRESANGLTVAACSFCGLQVQAHGEDSDGWLRRQAGAERKPTPEPGRDAHFQDEGAVKADESTKKTRARPVRVPPMWPFADEVAQDER